MIRRVLQIHTRYRQAGGEDRVVDAERQLLESAGIEVIQVLFDNADLRESESLSGDLRLAAEAVWARSAERRVSAALAANRPDVMHVHNTFTAASPSVYSPAKASGVPVVQTLHNYRFVCPAATAFRDGHVCTDCVGRVVPWPGVIHSCVRESRAQSFVAAATLAIHRVRRTFDGIDAYLALTAFQRNLMIDGGLPPERIRVVGNFLEPDPGVGTKVREGIVFAGRLSIEKGIDVLLDAASRMPGVISVVGSGPLADRVQRAVAAGSVVYLGPLPRTAVLECVRGAMALVLPSIWFEGFPLVVLEAFASGTPVIASRIGSIEELVDDGSTGLLVAPGDAHALAERTRWANDHPDEMRAMGFNARRLYESRFRGTSHLAALLDSYVAASRRRSA